MSKHTSSSSHASATTPHRIFTIVLLVLCSFSTIDAWRPCPELSPLLKFPCRCNLETQSTNPENLEVSIDCDGVVFNEDGPQFPYGTPVVTYFQRNSGQQKLTLQVIYSCFKIMEHFIEIIFYLHLQPFINAKTPLRSVDYSRNSIRTISERAFKGIESTLTELRLADNLLGDSLNPIFSTMELQVLSNLQVLDLSGNKIKGVEEGILKGCTKLQEFYLDNNNLTNVPSNSLNGPESLRSLSIRHNNIALLKTSSFESQPSLMKIDLRNNKISNIEGGAFYGLHEISEIYLGGNRITKMNSDVFQGAGALNKLDLSENFIEVFPSLILRETENLKVLNVSSNMIKVIFLTGFTIKRI